MVMQVNIGDHTSTQVSSGWIAMPARHLETMNWARRKAIWIAANKPAADVYFKSLSGGRTLTQIVNDSAMWINFRSDVVAYGWAETPGKELAITTRAFKEGRWQVLASLCHELAHTNGADVTSVPGNEAELAVLHCGMGYQKERTTGVDDPFTPYNPTITG